MCEILSKKHNLITPNHVVILQPENKFNLTPENFNIRVYGILLRDGAVLVSDELVGGSAMTKFPGGGLEFGEGIEECLLREFDEELDIEIKIDNIYYVNDFYQASAFNPKEQLISIYYIVSQVGKKTIPIAKKPFAFPPQIKQCFRWMEISKLRQLDFTYPIDQKIAQMLKNEEHINNVG